MIEIDEALIESFITGFSNLIEIRIPKDVETDWKFLRNPNLNEITGFSRSIQTGDKCCVIKLINILLLLICIIGFNILLHLLVFKRLKGIACVSSFIQQNQINACEGSFQFSPCGSD